MNDLNDIVTKIREATPDTAHKILAHAIFAERERCAQIAESFVNIKPIPARPIYNIDNEIIGWTEPSRGRRFVDPQRIVNAIRGN